MLLEPGRREICTVIMVLSGKMIDKFFRNPSQFTRQEVDGAKKSLFEGLPFLDFQVSAVCVCFAAPLRASVCAFRQLRPSSRRFHGTAIGSARGPRCHVEEKREKQSCDTASPAVRAAILKATP